MKHKIDDIIDIYNKCGLLALRDYIEIHGAQVYDATTLQEFIIILINTLIKIDLYHCCNGSIYQELKEAMSEYEKTKTHFN